MITIRLDDSSFENETEYRELLVAFFDAKRKLCDYIDRKTSIVARAEDTNDI